jgi:hypothetical protein
MADGRWQMVDGGWQMAGQPTLTSLQKTTYLSMALPTALQNTNRIMTIMCLGLFQAAFMAMSPTTLLLLRLLLAQTAFVT